MLNPSATSPLHLAMLEFVGVLFGVALRTSFPLPLDLPPSLWKQVLGEQPSLADLEAVDKFCVQVAYPFALHSATTTHASHAPSMVPHCGAGFEWFAGLARGRV